MGVFVYVNSISKLEIQAKKNRYIRPNGPRDKLVLKFQVFKKPYPSLPEAQWVLNSPNMDFDMKKVV